MKKILKFLAAAAFAVVVYQLVSLHRKRRKMVSRFSGDVRWRKLS